MTPIEIRRLGRVPYADAWSLQNRLADERAANPDSPDMLLLLEHPPTYTLGSAAKAEHILLAPDELAARGIEVVRTDRGGDVTYHGDGQLVGYPIMQLAKPDAPGGLRADVVGYVRQLERVIIATLADYDVRAYPIAGLTGVWVDTPQGECKIAAIGVRVNVKLVTKHGFALNVNTDLSYFDGIVPCGIRDKGVTSLAAVLGREVDIEDVTARLVAYFGAVFRSPLYFPT
ncbi:MAG: lipoyl(octanoyl) transferase LipB [Chloroflexota bacterium]|nr:lipoyl(octanoyl) transferase LipB [Chloroflexota bacterium]